MLPMPLADAEKLSAGGLLAGALFRSVMCCLTSLLGPAGLGAKVQPAWSCFFAALMREN